MPVSQLWRHPKVAPGDRGRAELADPIGWTMQQYSGPAVDMDLAQLLPQQHGIPCHGRKSCREHVPLSAPMLPSQGAPWSEPREHVRLHS